MIRISFAILGGVGLAFLAFVELGLAYPVSGWHYLIGVGFLAAGLIRRGPIRPQRQRLAVVAVVAAVVATLYSVEWATRKPFLRDMSRVRPGMTEPEVRQIMGRYQEGTGWSDSPRCTATQPMVGQDGERRESQMVAQPSGGSHEMTLPNSLVFRHSDAARYNSDWGIISFSGGRVVGVSFDAD